MSITVPSSTRRLSMPRLALDMLRYRVAVMMWLFMLLGAAYHRVDGWPLDELLALTVALAASYIAATTVNDISDEEIDKVNHPSAGGVLLCTARPPRRTCGVSTSLPPWLRWVQVPMSAGGGWLWSSALWSSDTHTRCRLSCCLIAPISRHRY